MAGIKHAAGVAARATATSADFEAEWVTTSTLLEQLRDFNDGAAWQRFVHWFQVPVQRFAMRMGLSQADAEDVAQESLLSFAQAFRQDDYDRSKGRLSSWLFGIAYRRALRQLRDVQRRPVTIQPDLSGQTYWRSLPDEDTASDCWQQEWEQSVLNECMNRVRTEVEVSTWDAFDMVVLQNRPVADVAQALGIAKTAVYNAKHRVLKRIRELREQIESLHE